MYICTLGHKNFLKPQETSQLTRAECGRHYQFQNLGNRKERGAELVAEERSDHEVSQATPRLLQTPVKVKRYTQSVHQYCMQSVVESRRVVKLSDMPE